MTDFGVVLVTIDSQEAAIALAETLINERLAACINLFPVQSVYSWQGQVQHENEWQLLIKTQPNHYDTLADKITALHPYDVPEIIMLPVTAGLPAYLSWVREQTQP
ncbi:MAG: divalent-cation tolerance protein CutA [Leptolyngbyaceae cyanobacterium]